MESDFGWDGAFDDRDDARAIDDDDDDDEEEEESSALARSRDAFDDDDDDDDARRRRRRRATGRRATTAATAFERTVAAWTAKDLTANAREGEGGRMVAARATYASADAWYATCEALAYEEARATTAAATARGRGEAFDAEVVETRASDGFVELSARRVGGEKTARRGGDDADWRRPATVVLLRRADDETRSALALVRGRGDARGADVVPLLAKRSRIFDDVEGVEFKAVALASLVSYQRMAHACFVRPRVAFAHQIVGAKRATHIKFSDSDDDDDDDDERVDGKSGVESDDESSCDEREGEYVLPLNASQRRALRRFFARDGHFDQLQMVQGPPGCGKTHFIVSLLAVLAAKKQRVLVCAPSNKAVCVVMELYLRTCGEDAAPCVLTGAEDTLREASSVDGGAMDYFIFERCNVIASSFRRSFVSGGDGIRESAKAARRALESIAPSFCKGVVAEGLSAVAAMDDEASMRARGEEIAREIEKGSGRGERSDEFAREALNRASLVFCTLASAGQSIMSSLEQPDALVVDEAAQALEPEIAIPFLRYPRKALLVGDPAQLPATLISEIARRHGHATSLMERLMSANAERASLLDTQYRMHPSIASWPAAQFYGGRLANADHVLTRNLPQGLSSSVPSYAFVDVASVESGGVGKSKWNQREADVACALIRALKTKSPTLFVVCITFYSAQVRAIARALQRAGVRDVAVHSVDSFQGSEADVVVCSAVRSNAKANVGFLSDKRRLNVALTRAKYSSIVLGSRDTLSRCGVDALRSLVEDAAARDVIVSEHDIVRRIIRN